MSFNKVKHVIPININRITRSNKLTDAGVEICVIRLLFFIFLLQGMEMGS